ncbi:CoA-binding protein [Sphingobacterium sp. E70]|uniref:CoA-binding protein n=1 Tax=Sphingobacterium sp. E70 TaxID=2853439 RepID=UPI002795D830|nr:CoA-binding protein [Sphingobacterium sp. E70]
MKKTLILGASTNPSRYSNKAANMLRKHGHDIVNIGLSGEKWLVRLSRRKVRCIAILTQ